MVCGLQENGHIEVKMHLMVAVPKVSGLLTAFHEDVGYSRLDRRWKVNGGVNKRSAMWRTLEHATNVSPQENSFLPMSTTTLLSVSPWDLWMVTA